MAGIKASSASKVMADGDVAVTDVEIGYITGEQIALATLPSGSSYAWVVAKPSSSTVRASLSLATSATPTFTPDVAGEYVFVCVVDGATSYVLRTSVTAVAQTTALESIRYQPLTDVRVPTPPSGGAVYYSSDLNALAIKTSDDSVNQIGGADHYRTFKNKTASAIASSLIAGTASAIRRYRITGTLVIDQILTLPSFVDIDATGATITTTLAPVVGLADDQTNHLINIAGVVGAVATTTTAFIAPGDTTIPLTSTAGITVDSWIRIRSYNDVSYPANYTTADPIYADRMYRVKTVASGTSIVIHGLVRYWQASGSAVVSITPKEGITWRGGRFDCSGGSIANGFYLESVVDCTLDALWCKGFSRAFIEIEKGSFGINVTDPEHGGELNCLVYAQRSEFIKITGLRSPLSAVATRHANGVARHLIVLRRRCANVQVIDSHAAWATGFCQIWSVNDVIVDTFHFENLDGTNRPGTSDGMQNMKCGIGIDCGQHVVIPEPPNVDGAGFSQNIQIYGGSGGPCKFNALQCGMYVHDIINGVVLGYIQQNSGRAAGAYKALIVSDSAVMISDIYLAGTGDGITFENNGMYAGSVTNYTWGQANGDLSATGGVPFAFNQYGSSNNTLRNIKINNANVLWRFDPSFNEPELRIHDLYTQAGHISLLRVAVNSGSTPATDGVPYQITGVGGLSNAYPAIGNAGCALAPGCVASASDAGTPFTGGGYGMVQVIDAGLESTVRYSGGPAYTKIIGLQGVRPTDFPGLIAHYDVTGPMSLTGLSVDHWFDQSGSATADDAIGKAAALPTYVSQDSGLPAVALSGAQHFEIAQSAETNPTAQCSVSIWLKPGNVGTNQYLLSQWLGNARWRIGFDGGPPNLLFAECGSGNNNYFDFGTATTWAHLVVVFDGSQATPANRIRIYKNGAIQALTQSGTNPATMPVESLAAVLGAHSAAGAQRFTGRLGSFAMWNTALTAAQIASLYMHQKR